MRNRLVQVVCAGLVTASAASAQPVRTEVRVDSSLYDGYVGRYHLSPTAALIITRDGDHLFAQVGNLPPAEIFPASTKRYFYKEIDAQITFETDGRGQATAVIRRVDGKDSRGKRLGDLPKPFDLAPARFDTYVGQYQFTQGVVLAITREGAQFFAQLTGQSRVEMFPSSERVFFMKAVEAQVTIEVDAAGRATAVALHQNGKDVRASRVP